jgi:hypothetical protein
MCVFVTGKNVVHDEKDLAKARSLSLWTQFVCVSRSSTIMSLERKFIQQLCRNQTGFPRVQDCTCQSSIPDDDAFPYGMRSPTSGYDHAKTKQKKEIKNSPIFQALYQEFLQERSIGKRWRRRTMYRKENKKLPWHTVWISSCMIQLEKETLSIEIALSCASCTWCSSLLWQQRRSWSSLRESDFVPLHRNAVHFVVDLWRIAATCTQIFLNFFVDSWCSWWKSTGARVASVRKLLDGRRGFWSVLCTVLLDACRVAILHSWKCYSVHACI